MIGNAKIIITTALILCINAIAVSQNIEEPFLVKSGDENIDCQPPNSAPLCVDYDGDGLQDLIVGTLRGKFRFYKNKGTSNVPVYDDFTFIQANGKDAKIKNW